MENKIKEGTEDLKPHTIKIKLLLTPLKLLFLSILAFNFPSVSAQNLKVIAMTQIVQHPSLDQARRGILDELNDSRYEIGQNIKLIEQNAQGSVANAALIAKNFISLKPAAIVTIFTTSTQSMLAASKESNIHIISSSVTDPVAAGLTQDINQPNEKITGSMDFPPIAQEIELIEALTPHIKTIGLLYSAGEANSVKTIELMKEAIGIRWNVIEVTVASTTESISGLTYLIGKVDAVYIPSDNTVFAVMPKLMQISRKNKLSIYFSDPDSVIQGFTACVGYTQHSIGRVAGKLLVKTLHGERLLKIEKPENPEIFVNAISAEKIGLKFQAQLMVLN